jgi:hypothetical protein
MGHLKRHLASHLNAAGKVRIVSRSSYYQILNIPTTDPMEIHNAVQSVQSPSAAMAKVALVSVLTLSMISLIGGIIFSM